MGYQWVVRSVSLTDRIIHLVWMHLKNSLLSAWHSPVASIAAGVSAAGTAVSGSVTGAVSGASPVSMSSAGGWSPTGARPPVFTTVGALTAEATAGDWAIVTIPVKDTSWLLFVIPIIAWLGECPAYMTQYPDSGGVMHWPDEVEGAVCTMLTGVCLVLPCEFITIICWPGAPEITIPHHDNLWSKIVAYPAGVMIRDHHINAPVISNWLTSCLGYGGDDAVWGCSTSSAPGGGYHYRLLAALCRRDSSHASLTILRGRRDDGTSGC